MGETHSLLLDLAETLIRKRGYDGFSYADIASDAGIRKASIHYHFPTKPDLGLAVLDRYKERLIRRLGDIGRKSRTGGQAVTEVIELYRPAEDAPDLSCLCVVLSGETLSISDQMVEALDRSNREVITAIEGMLITGRRDRSISVGGDPSLEAMAILAQLQGAQLLARTGRDPEIFDEAVSTLVTRISRH